MTVKELIRDLEEYPQDADVKLVGDIRHTEITGIDCIDNVVCIAHENPD